MKSVIELTLNTVDLKAAILYWLENYHGYCYDETSGDRVSIREDKTATVTIKDELS
jgi:hypothetical protein